MRIVVLADTHIPHRATDLPGPVWDAIESADLVIHAGDFTSYDFLVELRSLKEVKGVYGNMDEYRIAEELPEKAIFEIEGVKVGVIHGFGAPLGLEKRVRQRFEKDRVDLIIYGHSHQAVWKQKNGVYLLNPGTPTDTLFSRKRTYALLVIQKGKFNAEIVSIR